MRNTGRRTGAASAAVSAGWRAAAAAVTEA